MVRTYHHFLWYWVCTKTMKCHDRTSIQGLLDFQIGKHLKKKTKINILTWKEWQMRSCFKFKIYRWRLESVQSLPSMIWDPVNPKEITEYRLHEIQWYHKKSLTVAWRARRYACCWAISFVRMRLGFLSLCLIFKDTRSWRQHRTPALQSSAGYTMWGTGAA